MKPDILVSAGDLYKTALQHYEQKRMHEAADALSQITHLYPEYDPAYAFLAKIFREEGEIIDAIECYSIAIRLQPGNSDYKQGFINAARHTRAVTANPALKEIVLQCLQNDKPDFSDMGALWYSLLLQEPDFQKILKCANKKKYEDFKIYLEKQNIRILEDPFFLYGLRRVTVFDAEFENFLTYIRRWLLGQNIGSGALIDALGTYCYRTEYIFYVSPEEKSLLDALPDTSVLKDCYLSRDEFKVNLSIPQITAVEDDISKKVRFQYEEFPYPRWQSFSADIKDEKYEGHLKNAKSQILVAGCGTGKEAIEFAAAFPDAQITAIDLSRASLTYAIGKAKEYGIDNITFGHGDILNLGTLDMQTMWL